MAFETCSQMPSAYPSPCRVQASVVGIMSKSEIDRDVKLAFLGVSDVRTLYRWYASLKMQQWRRP